VIAQQGFYHAVQGLFKRVEKVQSLPLFLCVYMLFLCGAMHEVFFAAIHVIVG
jgi:hypothetical protein